MSKRRGSFDQNMKLYQYEKEWYKHFNTKFIDVNDKASIEVEKSLLEMLTNNNFLRYEFISSIKGLKLLHRINTLYVSNFPFLTNEI